MKILITGTAGFIGYHLANKLLMTGHEVVGIDNLNNYYDVNLKKLRLNNLKSHKKKENFKFYEKDISDREYIKNFFKENSFEIVIHLAAQAGVRFSLENPHEYVDSNLVGFVNILEGCRHSCIDHMIFASSSSVYGLNVKQPFSESDSTDYPISLYAATKKSNELIAHSYSHLFNIPITGLRFFTVYGPYGRPDMAYFKFTKSILNQEPIDVFNNGDMLRDFTYIDDIVLGIESIIEMKPKKNITNISNSKPQFKIYNIGNNKPVYLRDFIESIESACNRKAIKNFMPMQDGDVYVTYADIDELENDTGFRPSTNINDGIKKFVDWYINYRGNI